MTLVVFLNTIFISKLEVQICRDFQNTLCTMYYYIYNTLALLKLSTHIPIGSCLEQGHFGI